MNPEASIPTRDWTLQEQKFMSRALELAELGQYCARPNPMVGCVLVGQDGQVVGEGWHEKSGQAHAEVNALNMAGDKAKNASCYVTLEPCAHFGKTGPCAKALVDAGVKRVVAAMQDPNPAVCGKGFALLQNAGIEVGCGLLENQARQLNRGFISRFSRNRPWLTCKLAMSLDGRTALASGESQWITSPDSRLDVHRLRARQDAIITGIGTLLADNPSLTVRGELDPDWFERLQSSGFVQPARVLLDRHSKASLSAKLFMAGGDCYWMASAAAESRANWPKELAPMTPLDPELSLSQLLTRLAELGMNQVMLEAGQRLAAAFLKQGLIDELVVYLAPKIMGNQGMALFDLEVKTMLETPRLELVDVRRLGQDLKLTYFPVKPESRQNPNPGKTCIPAKPESKRD